MILVKNIVFFLFFTGAVLMNAQKFSLPKNYSVFKTIKGDLEKEGDEETVLVCNIYQTSDPKKSYGRKLFILKQDGNDFILWNENSTLLRDTEDFGISFDDNETSLVKLEIKNNTLVIVQKTYNTDDAQTAIKSFSASKIRTGFQSDLRIGIGISAILITAAI